MVAPLHSPLLPLLLLPLLPLATLATWTPKCDGSSEPRDLQGRSYALLHAHRCFLRDVPVRINSPLNSIPDSIIPSHVVVPRCAGLCLGSLGSSCTPKRTKLEQHNIVVYVNSTPYCTTIELDHHRGPCRCECDRSSCPNPRQVFDASSCSCSCLPTLAEEKVQCSNSTLREWDSSSCSCRCRGAPLSCTSPTSWDSSTCSCVLPPLLNTPDCRLEGVEEKGGGSSLAAINLYPVLVIVMAVILFLLLITSLSFTLSSRWRSPPTQHRIVEPASLQPKAYTITLCSNQSLDKAA